MKFDQTGEIRQRLLKEMKTGIFSEVDRLPRETILAEHYGISRNHLRDILAQLESEGFITRRHGVGTMINHHVLSVVNRMDIETEFMDIIRQSGYKPEIGKISMMEEVADSFVAEKLNIPLGTDVVQINRVCTADGKPAIYCEDIIEKSLIKQDFMMNDLRAPIFLFLQKFCGVDAYMDLTQFHAVLADEHLAKVLEVPVGTPLLHLEEVDYDIEGNIVFYSKQYFCDRMIEQSVMRKKL